MKQVCIIQPNEISYTDIMQISRFTYDILEDEIEDFIEFRSVENTESFINLIQTEISPPEGAIINTTNVYETIDYVYQMCYISPYNEEFKELNEKIIRKQKNGIGKIFVNKELDVYSKVIITKSRVTPDNNIIEDSINFKDIINIFRKKMVQIGVLIKPNGNLEEREYASFPLFSFSKSVDTYKYFEIEFCNRIFMFFVELEPKENVFNEIASVLYGKSTPLHGDVFVAIRNKPTDLRIIEQTFSDITSDLVTKLVKLIYHTEFSRTYEPEFFNHETQKYQNFYNYIEGLYLKSNLTKPKQVFTYNPPTLNEIAKNK